MRFRVYVPVDKSYLTIRDGSGIVGSEVESIDGGSKLLMIDYEGAIYGQDMRFAEKCLHAAGRQAAKYPTVARVFVKPESMKAIGWFYDDIGVVELDDNDAWRLLAAWLNITPNGLISNQKHILQARGARWGRV